MAHPTSAATVNLQADSITQSPAFSTALASVSESTINVETTGTHPTAHSEAHHSEQPQHTSLFGVRPSTDCWKWGVDQVCQTLHGPPSYQQPRQIYQFSYDENLVPHFDDRALKYYRHPEKHADLKLGFESFQSKSNDGGENHLDDLLAALEDARKCEIANDRRAAQEEVAAMKTSPQEAPDEKHKNHAKSNEGTEPSKTDRIENNDSKSSLNQDVKLCSKKLRTGNKDDGSVGSSMSASIPVLEGRQNETNFRKPINEGVDFVMWRGLMSKIFITPFSHLDRFHEPWRFAAVRVNGCIYLDEIKPESREMDRRGKLLCYGGFKFEQYCTTGSLEEALQSQANSTTSKTQHEPINNSVAYCAIFRTKLGQHRVIMGAEMDCIIPNGEKWNLGSYVELKTSKTITSQWDQDVFERNKLLKSWAQSFLAGVNTIVYGFRDNNSIVTAVQEFKTLEVHRLAKRYWDPQKCMAFAQGLLNMVKKVVVDDARESTYIFEYNNNNRSVNAYVDKSEERLQFLPKGFVDTHSNENVKRN
eukprot:CFRG3074T1